MEAGIADESDTPILCSAEHQAGDIFNPNIVASVVWSFNQKQIYVVAAVRFLADVQRNVAAVIAAVENVDTNV